MTGLRRRRRGPKFVMLHDWFLDCPAWSDLTPNARAVYIELKRRYNGLNNGSISLSTRDAGKCIKASNDTGARALIELQEHGFIEVTSDSNFNRKIKVSREYLLTEEPNDLTGLAREPRKTFMRWRPAALPSAPQAQNTVAPIGLTVAPIGLRGVKIA